MPLPFSIYEDGGAEGDGEFNGPNPTDDPGDNNDTAVPSVSPAFLFSHSRHIGTTYLNWHCSHDLREF